MEKKDNKFHFVTVTDEDIKRENERVASNLTEEQKTDFVFGGEPLYELGRGHAFIWGFFTEYLTKSAVKAVRYDSGKWHINGDEYVYENETFVLVPPPPPTEPADWSTFTFPVVRQVSANLLANSITPIKPKKDR
jgi:hypothetical protein